MTADSDAVSMVRGDMSPLQRGTPPGSLRYFSVLFAPPRARPMLQALYAYEAEIRDSAAAPSHDVAHTRLHWWRGEIDRLVAGRPQHPVTIALVRLAECGSGDPTLLHELLVAADLDLARMTYASESEREAYCFRASGALQTLAAAALAGERPLTDAERLFARELGAVVRQCEMLRDLRSDLARGNVYLPLAMLDAAGVDVRDLQRTGPTTVLDDLLAGWRQRVGQRLAALPGSLPPAERNVQCAGLVLGALHERLLRRIAGTTGDPVQRAEVPHFSRLWTAWRTAVRYG